MAEERPNMFARAMDAVQGFIRPDYSHNREVQRAAALAIATEQREVIDFARAEAVTNLGKLADIPPTEREAELKLERIDATDSKEWSAEDWADKAKLAAKVEADVQAWAKDNNLKLTEHEDRLAAYVGVGSAYGAAHLSVNYREWEAEYWESHPKMTAIGEWKDAGPNSEYRTSVAVIDGAFHPAYEVSPMGGEGQYNYSELAFPTAEEAQAVADSFYRHAEYGNGEAGFRRDLAELGQLPQGEYEFSNSDRHDFANLQERFSRTDFNYPYSDDHRARNQGQEEVKEAEAAFEAFAARSPLHAAMASSAWDRATDLMVPPHGYMTVRERDPLLMRSEEFEMVGVPLTRADIERAVEDDRNMYAQLESQLERGIANVEAEGIAAFERSAGAQQEAVTAGRDAALRGENVVDVHGRPFVEPGNDPEVSAAAEPKRDAQAVIEEARTARITTALSDLADAVTAGERPEFHTEAKAEAFRRDLETRYGEGVMERLRAGDTSDLARDVADRDQRQLVGAAVRMVAESHAVLRGHEPEQVVTHAATIDRDSGPDFDL